MSLTSLLDLKDIKTKFRETFPKPKTVSGEMIAPPLTKNNSLVGTAFDYLLRFNLQQRFSLATSTRWVASQAKNENVLKSNPRVYQIAKEILAYATNHHKIYLQNGHLTHSILRSCLMLAQLDLIFRRKIIVPTLGNIQESDIIDLRQLLSVVPEGLFIPKNICLLNPTFDIASIFVHGADIDLVIDDTLIDIKTTKNHLLERNYYNQVIGYYILYRLSGITGASPDHEITQLAIYSARYGKLHVFPLTSIATEETFANFTDWFVARTEQEFGIDFRRIKSALWS